MSTHLPECDLSIDCGLPHCQGYCQECEMYCICDRLNACTARVRAACIAALSDLPGFVDEETGKWSYRQEDAIQALREIQP